MLVPAWRLHVNILKTSPIPQQNRFIWHRSRGLYGIKVGVHMPLDFPRRRARDFYTMRPLILCHRFGALFASIWVCFFLELLSGFICIDLARFFSGTPSASITSVGAVVNQCQRKWKAPLTSGTKKEPKPKLFGPDIFGWGEGLPREWVGPKSSVCPSKPGKSNFFGGISRDFAGISRRCRKV